MESTTKRVALNVESSRAAVTAAVAAICDLVRSCIAREELMRLDLALQELLSNAFEHGNLGLTSSQKMALCESGEYDREIERMATQAQVKRLTIIVEASFLDGVFTCQVTDQGVGFDWKGAFQHLPTAADTISDPSGRGLFIIRNTFDTVRYEGNGNCVVVTKRLQCTTS